MANAAIAHNAGTEAAEVCQYALAIVVANAGGKLKISAQDLERLPPGALAYAYQPDGSVEFTYVRE